MSNIISINNLSKNFKTFSLNINNLDIEEGLVTGFVGENGAGKTTTINLIMGMAKRESGEISIMGSNNVRLPTEVKKEIGYVGDENIFYPDFKLKTIVTSLAPFYDNFDYGIFTKLCEQFKVDVNRRYKILSKGQKQMFAIVFALSHQPKLMIMDEPTAGLDPAARAEILEVILKNVVDRGMSVFLSTHITSDLESIADKIVFLHKGNIMMDMCKDDLIEKYAVVKGYNKFLGDRGEELFTSIHKTEFSFEGITDNIELAKAYFGNEVIYEKPTIENIFVSLIRGDK